MLAALATFALAVAAVPQPATAAAPATPAPAAAPSAAANEDAIFDLVRAGRCGQAKAAAEKAQDMNLAGQIGLMCGARSSGAPSSKGEGGGRRGSGGGQAGGRRGGGS